MHAEVYARRRAELRARMGPGAVAVIPATREALRNGDSEFPYRASSDLAYLTGFHEPEAVAVISTAHEHDFVLFVRPRDPERETWTGRRAGVEGAVSRYGAKAAFRIDELEAKLPTYLADAQSLFFRLADDPELDAKLLALLAGMRRRARLKGHPPYRIEDLGQVLHELRLFKQPEELAALERAAHITAEAYRVAMQRTRAGQREYEVQAELEYVYRRNGGTAGYSPIVAGGENATILHYHENDAELRPGQLLLIDSGCEHQLYTADVSRTFPVDGRFTPEQRAFYEVVLAAQDVALGMCKPGETLPAIHQATIRRLVEGMLELKLLSGSIDELIEKGAFKRFYMHGTSHWLGMDVHDVGRYDRAGEARKLEPNMVFTVEPGLYVPADASDVPAHFRGVGVRIEDDVMITAEGHRSLTGMIPRTVAEVEAACAR